MPFHWFLIKKKKKYVYCKFTCIFTVPWVIKKKKNSNKKEDSHSPKYTTIFLLSEKKQNHKPSKVATAINIFCRVDVIGAICFVKYFLFHVTTERLLKDLFAIACFAGCDVNFEINLIFLIKPFLYKAKK